MNQDPQMGRRIEARWPVILTILVVTCLLVTLPGRVRVWPVWLAYVGAAMIIVPMAAVGLTEGRARWLRIEHTVLLFFIFVVGAANLANLLNLIRRMIGRSVEIGGLQLLASSIAVWVTNVIVFSLLYWQIARRMDNGNTKSDWQFPQTSDPEGAPEGWRPTFVDYLCLAYTTATAFSPTDVLPLTSRAKLLMMLQSTISLVTIVLVGSRAINILGG